MEQKCTVRSLYFSGAVFLVFYPAGLALLAHKHNWAAFVVWLVFVPAFKWAYLRFFPLISRWKGYGTVEDKPPAKVETAPIDVTYYSLLGCPFCPIVSRRLDALQKEMGFMLKKVDLTLKPQVAASKGIRSVPVVEVGKNRIVGNATTEQLAQLIAHAQVA